MLAGVSTVAFGQSREELEKRKKQLNQDIEYTNKILKQTQEKKAVSLKGLRVLNSQIQTREKVITTINTQIKVISNQIVEKNRNISSLQQQLELLKKEYAAMVLFAFRNQSAYNKLMFIFAANDFNQAYKRMKYLQQFGTYRRKQAEYIERTKQALNVKVMELNTDKKDKNTLLGEEQKEKVTLTKEKQKQTQVVGQLQSREKNLRQEIAKKQREAQKLNKAIQDIIRREIEAARKKAEEEARRKAEAEAKAKGTTAPTATPKTASGSSVLSSTPEGAKLTADFESNRGRLPWPVEKGIIVERFGIHPHPVLEKVETNNDGVDIKTNPGASVRAVFGGKVVAVTALFGEYAILINHGEYFTVYSNLRSVSVSKGQMIGVKQAIGTVSTDADGNSELNFQVRKGATALNPEYWLAN
ncbi:peptidoglycan DD-metalloendopeptidase family protein [Solitalea sp. MAHUQ-68]|uniref:Peptidoglycan DD-metalloendopeptidase family protein n=1 Tax=Solitalea agri TaxID=2953739 RepID=A0A9X2F203_9SPHI|nr:peptidoglycan DD-metalloendopeptidase family protein [Solitalea agri]MCO4293142.1 peptidoglycan DD-metalloendopeptidase family protein [Solitalea agri]